MSDLEKRTETALVLPIEQVESIQNELLNIREDLQDDQYILEARKVLGAEGLRSTIGCYWNAVSHDLRMKVMHRSLDLFNKEMSKTVKTYEDFQKNVTDHELVEGAYKIGVLSYEAWKVVQQARETRNIFDGHPKSTSPGLLKVLSLISDCNKYVLAVEYPIPIINVNDYITQMDTDEYSKETLLVEHAVIDLPDVYKSEMANKLFTYYTGDAISTRFRANIEFTYPILWSVLSKDSRQQIGKTFEKKYVENNSSYNEKATSLLASIDGLRYISSSIRKLIYEPKIKYLEDSLDSWTDEGIAVNELESFGSVIPDDYIDRLVTALTLTFVGRRGYSTYAARTAFYSDSAAPRIVRMFEKFDNKSAEAFVKTVMKNETLAYRIMGSAQLRRLRILGTIIHDIPGIKKETLDQIDFLCDEGRTTEFLQIIEKNLGD